MHEIYKPFEGQEVTAEIIASIIQQVGPLKETIRRALNRELFGGKPENDKELQGMQLIIQEIILQYVIQVLKYDKENCPFRISRLEAKLQVSLPVMIQGKTQDVWLGGVVDRIDRYQGTVRIIDYKTGTNKVIFPDLNALFGNQPSLRNDAAFQLFLYAFLCHAKLKGEHVVPWLYIIREFHKADFNGMLKDQSAHKGTVDYNDYHASFSALLSGMLESLFDPSVPFIQTSDEEYCKHCPYKTLCHRH
jgi:ATP-dependent exoDNAse (exonuclease V) beta subunit